MTVSTGTVVGMERETRRELKKAAAAARVLSREVRLLEAGVRNGLPASVLVAHRAAVGRAHRDFVAAFERGSFLFFDAEVEGEVK